MRPRFALPVLALTAALAAPAAAGASLAPVFGEPVSVAGPSDTIVRPKVAVTADRTFVIWRQTVGGHAVVRFSERPNGPDGAWSAPVTISAADEDVTEQQFLAVADRDGNFTVVWRLESTWQIKARTLLAGRDDWSPEATLATGSTTHPSLERGPDGTVVASWGAFSPGNNRIRIVTRAAGSGAWGTPVDIAQGNDDPRATMIAFNASGDGVVVWDVAPNGGGLEEIRAARYDHGTASWSGPAYVAVQTAVRSADFMSATISPQGTAAAAWTDSGTSEVMAAVSAAGDGWSDPKTLTDGPEIGILPDLAADSAGNIVALYQTYVPDMNPLVMYGSSRAQSRTLQAGHSTWDPGENVSGDQFGGGTEIVADTGDGMVATMYGGSSLDLSRLGEAVAPVELSVIRRPDGASAWSDPIPVWSGPVSITAIPSGAIGPDGDVAVGFMPAGAGSERDAAVALGDGSAPEAGGLSIPSSGAVGEDLPFSVDPADRWSGVASTSWSFGDGTAASGASVSHVYAQAGTYTVTVTVTDGAGQRTTRTGQLVITGPPADDEQTPPAPPKALAPVIEARLTGRTLSLNVKVTLKAGQKCKGTVKATTAFGGRTYKVPAKLAVKNGACRATAQITLKKTPSLRTKLRVTLSGKQAKARTITSRRG